MNGEPQRVTIAGGTVWIGLMLFIIAMNTCDLDRGLSRIERAIKALSQTSGEKP